MLYVDEMETTSVAVLSAREAAVLKEPPVYCGPQLFGLGRVLEGRAKIMDVVYLH